MSRKNEILRIVVFIVLLVAVVAGLTSIFGAKQTAEAGRINSFFDEPKNTIDLLYFGTSAVDRYWCEPVAWHDFGISSYCLSSGKQLFVTTRYYIEESLRWQSPKVIVVDIRSFYKEPTDLDTRTLRSGLDMMPYSWTWVKAANALIKYSENEEYKGQELSFYFRLLQYHGRWEGDLSKFDFHKRKSPIKGFVIRQETFKTVGLEQPAPIEDSLPIHEKTVEALEDFLDYCDTLNSSVLFVASPAVLKDGSGPYINSVQSIIEQRGYPVINFNRGDWYERLDLDFKKDFYNNTHVNLSGAIKYTDFFAAYLQKEYGLPDHRDNDSYQAWDKSYEAFREKARVGWKSEWDVRSLR